MSNNCFKLNENKTEYMLIGSIQSAPPKKKKKKKKTDSQCGPNLVKPGERVTS